MTASLGHYALSIHCCLPKLKNGVGRLRWAAPSMLSTGSREWACDKHIGGKAHKGTLVAGPDRRAVLELLGLGGLATVLPPADDCGLPDPLGTHLFGILRI